MVGPAAAALTLLILPLLLRLRIASRFLRGEPAYCVVVVGVVGHGLGPPLTVDATPGVLTAAAAGLGVLEVASPGAGLSWDFCCRLTMGDRNGFRRAALAASTRRRLAAGPGVCVD